MNGIVKVASTAAVAIAAAFLGAAAGYAVHKPVSAPAVGSICAAEAGPVAAFVSRAAPVIATEVMPSDTSWMRHASKVDF